MAATLDLVAYSAVDMPPHQHTTFGGWLRAARLAAGYRSQEAFAEAIGAHAVTVNRWETGALRPQAHRHARIAEVVGLPVDALRRALDTRALSVLQPVVATPITSVVTTGGEMPTDDLARSLGLAFQAIPVERRLDAWLELGQAMARWARQGQDEDEHDDERDDEPRRAQPRKARAAHRR